MRVQFLHLEENTNIQICLVFVLIKVLDSSEFSWSLWWAYHWIKLGFTLLLIKIKMYRCKKRNKAMAWKILCQSVEFFNFFLFLFFLFFINFKLGDWINFLSVKIAWNFIVLLFEIVFSIFDIVWVVEQFDFNS